MPRPMLVACCLLFSLSGPLARADAPVEARRHDSVLLVQPFASFGAPTVTFEQVIDDRWAWGIGGGFAFLHNATTFGGTTQTVLLGTVLVVPGLDRYLTGRAPEGLFLGLRLPLGISPAGMSTSPQPDLRYSFGANALVGYSVVLGQGFAAEVGVGVGLEYSNFVTSAPGPFEGLKNRQLVAGTQALAAVGWAF